jgi:hypothetical protein
MGIALYPVRRYSIFLVAPAGFAVYVAAIYFLRAIEPDEWRLAREGLISRLRRA